jgi:peptide/nickel transport system substrate-binding protein
VKKRIIASGALSVVLLLAACGPSAPGGQGRAQDTGPGPSAAGKTLQIGTALPDEPEPANGGIGFNNKPAGYMFHSALVMYDPTTGELQPRLAERLPTLENGEWKILPEGGMEVTWKLRPNAVWHDGTPLSAEDFLFGFKVGMDGDIFARGTAITRTISDLTAPDPQTLVVRWKENYILANAMIKDTLVPLPRHLMLDLYDTGDKQAFAASPLHTTSWVGLGPYRLVQWQQGTNMEAEAFDRYFLGPAKIGRISIRFYADTNVLLSVVMAGDVDVVPQGAFKQEEAQVLKADWESRGMGTVILSWSDLRHGKPQWRYPEAPWVQDVRVRQALVHLIDRQSVVDTLKGGISAVGEIPLLEEDPVYRLAKQRGLPSYPFDPAQANRLLTEAGLTRGPDGVFRTRTGEPFTMEVAASADIASQIQELVVIADQLKAGGIAANPFPVPPSADRDKVRAEAKGIIVRGLDLNYNGLREFTTGEVSAESNRWRGRNFGGYSNQAFDEQVTRLLTTVQASQRNEIGADLFKKALEDVVWIPLWYGPDILAARSAVRGVTKVSPAQDAVAWNIHLWEIN